MKEGFWEVIGGVGGSIALIKFFLDFWKDSIRRDVFITFGKSSKRPIGLAVVVTNVGSRPFTIRSISAVQFTGIVWKRFVWGKSNVNNVLFDFIDSQQESSIISPSDNWHFQWTEFDKLMMSTHILVEFRPKRISMVKLPEEFHEARRWFLNVVDLVKLRAPSGIEIAIQNDQIVLIGGNLKCSFSPLIGYYFYNGIVNIGTGQWQPGAAEGNTQDLVEVLSIVLKEFVKETRNPKSGELSLEWNTHFIKHYRCAQLQEIVTMESQKNPNLLGERPVLLPGL